MKTETEIILPQGWKRRMGQALLGLLLTLGLLLVGRRVSPQGEGGFPLLLSPRLARIARYQQSVQGWANSLQETQLQLASLLDASAPGGLFAQNEQVEQAYGRILGVAQEIERTDVPPTMEPLHNLAQQAAEAALAAVGSVSLWVGEPAPANQQSAQAALAAAQDALAQLTSSPWLAQETVDE